MITVSLKDTLADGVFGPIHIGMLRADVQELLGAPDDWSAQDAATTSDTPWRTSAIWKYGDLEFHFGLLDEDRLALIFTDSFTVPSGGTAIALEPWIIHHDASQCEVEHALRKAHIEFRPMQSRIDEEVTGLAIGPRVRLWFVRQGPDAPPLLRVIACADPRLPSPEEN